MTYKTLLATSCRGEAPSHESHHESHHESSRVTIVGNFSCRRADLLTTREMHGMPDRQVTGHPALHETP
jgi:hypothetical protein